MSLCNGIGDFFGDIIICGWASFLLHCNEMSDVGYLVVVLSILNIFVHCLYQMIYLSVLVVTSIPVL